MRSAKENERAELDTLALVLLIPRWMLSYIGAATGSLIIQAIIAATVGAAFVIKIYWRRIAAFFRRKKTAEGEACPAADAEGGAEAEATLLPAEARNPGTAEASGTLEADLLPAEGQDPVEAEIPGTLEADLLPAETVSPAGPGRDGAGPAIPGGGRPAEEQGGLE